MKEKNSIYKYLTTKEVKKIKEFVKGKETPFLIVNPKKVEENYDNLHSLMPFAKIYYAVKANPMDEIVKLLEKKGSNFDVASIYEIDQCLRLGIPPERLSYGNPIKKVEHIAYAYKKGIRLYATDSWEDVQEIAKHAPGSKVLFRIILEGGNADWPLSRKFGAHPDMIYQLILKASKMNIIPYGLSFHVGSQQRDIGSWDNAISFCKYLFDALKQHKIKLKAINLGGGFPTRYVHSTHPLETYTKYVTRFLQEDFPTDFPEILIEPGRSMVGNCGVMVTQIVMISRKSSLDRNKWVYLDAGKFNGLIETIDESIKYPIFWEKAKKTDRNTEKVILAGPTCDSMDIMYEKYQYKFPKGMKEGDKMFILSTGAYTLSYCSVYFNGFPPMKAYILK
ncbi:MAG TPA: ornithine decarboxylase [Candidatus Magasanikbacteria bacterium]|nr:ornithine decarboxylase [Candidatus Magasanikbacteria bacterium]